MITLGTLQWDNCFSYGSNNDLKLDDANLTQLVGTNGQGKSSIPLILEEVLFNKNSKGIKKADIQNRYYNKGYNISLDFVVEQDKYLIKVNRSRGTIKVKLLKNGDDISSHTATNTYKTLEGILGVDFKTFSQLVYQNTNASLQFLTATDANRKKFLIDLFSLDEYMNYSEIFKSAARDIQSEKTAINAKVESIENWLNSNILDDTTILPMKNVSIETDDDEKILRQKLIEFEKIDSTNRKISENRLKKDLFKQIKISEITNIQKPEVTSWENLSNKVGEYNFAIRQCEATIDSISEIGEQCPTCSQPVSIEFVAEMIQGAENSAKKMTQSRENTKKEISRIQSEVEEWSKAVEKREQWAELKRSIDDNLPNEPIDSIRLQDDISDLENRIADAKSQIQKIIEENERRATRNTRIQVIQEQTREFESELHKHNEKLEKISAKLSNLEILKRAFSTSGLIAYKIENLVKDLEDMTNDYLAELSDGRFSINFVVLNDKLNVEITDNGKTVAITALSSGELTRVNTATLIAIRKLMSSISKSRINVLFLDEVINVLDEAGREKLVEILLKEEDLNTFVVSHGWTHPLLEKIEVIKENNISRLE
tara:strand:- start:748 stop:2547 length:1800 start_codon:yes stop_codon:yes gene_type:complete